MTTTPVLALPDFSLPFTVETNACDTGIGAVLSQQGHPIAFLSRALGVNNLKLSVYEKEFLAVMMAIDRWRPYLQHGQFTILTDHKSLCTLGEQQLGSEVQRKAMAKLGGLQFQFKYRRGIDNNAADSLSRIGHLFLVTSTSTCQPSWIQEVRNSYQTDAKATELLQALAVRSPDDQGHELDRGMIKFKGRLWIGDNAALQTKLISELHAAAVGGHSGIRPTYLRLKNLFYWPGMKIQVEEFVKQCRVCQHVKHEHVHPAGTLQPLHVPARAWGDVTMDFIEGLPRSEGADVILVVVDRLTKYAHFIALHHPFTAPQVARAFLDNIVKLHGVPASIVSDRDKIFTSVFWRELFKLVGTKLLYTTAYHPQTDGQSERVNQCLEHYLRCAVHDTPNRWKRWLPMAEFWYNSSFHSAIGCTPFTALYGVEPNFGALPNLFNVQTPDSLHELAAEHQQFTDLLKAHLLRAQQRMKHQADRKRTNREFSVGEQVLLKLQPYVQSSVVSRPCPKLAYKFFGPYKIISRIGSCAYKLDLPPESKIHPVFHVSQLKPFTADYSPVFNQLPAPPDLTIGDLVPQAILERRLVKKGNAAIPQVLVHWQTLSPASATWENYHVLQQRFRDINLDGGAASQEEATVTPSPPAHHIEEKTDSDAPQVRPNKENGEDPPTGSED